MPIFIFYTHIAFATFLVLLSSYNYLEFIASLFFMTMFYDEGYHFVYTTGISLLAGPLGF